MSLPVVAAVVVAADVVVVATVQPLPSPERCSAWRASFVRVGYRNRTSIPVPDLYTDPYQEHWCRVRDEEACDADEDDGEAARGTSSDL